MNIPFNKPFLCGNELRYIKETLEKGRISGNGLFTQKCEEWLRHHTGCTKALLTHSCTAALEMAAILAGIEPGDEIIMPSYTFVSTANAFVLRGGVPVFIDIRPDTLNMDEAQIEQAITEKTKAIVPVHYAGVACEMDTIQFLAHKYKLLVIEDAAQSIGCAYKGQPLGSMGNLGVFSFHETKNITCGEGGALLINESIFTERADIIREKGTDRSKYFRGELDKYSWVDIGSSYLPSEILAAFLYAQMEMETVITERRLCIWEQYYQFLAPLANKQGFGLPFVPDSCRHNGHIFYLKIRDAKDRSSLIATLKENGVQSVFHYVPLHSSPAGKKYGRSAGAMTRTEEISGQVLRLPLYYGMRDEDVERVVEVLYSC